MNLKYRTLAWGALALVTAGSLLPGTLLAQSTPEAGATTVSATPAAGTPVGSLRLIGEQIVPNDLEVGGALVGGLSGIDYDPASGRWFIISDDKSQSAPARFYLGTLDYDAGAFAAVSLDSVVTLLNEAGEPYPSPDTGEEIVDPEAIRFDSQSGTLWWTSEGDRPLERHPFVAATDLDGNQVAAWELPAAFHMHPDAETGSRHNLTLEGLTLAAGGASLWTGMESATYEDGPVATVDHGAFARLTNFDREGNLLAQYVYELDPMQAEPTGEEGLGDNGLTEILAIDDHRLLVIERSGVSQAAGPWEMYIRIYEADVTGATDVQDVASLADAEFTPVSKRLVLNLNESGLETIDNVEGITWGPVLENGNRSLVLVSDNNFNPEEQVTQFLAYEVLP